MGEAQKPIRIWYQSFVDPEAQAPYIDRLRARLAAVAGPGVVIDVHGIRPPTEAAEQHALRQDFAGQAGALIERGADILIPAGGLPMLLFAQLQPFLIGQVPVLEGIATVEKATEMAVALHRLTGVPASRAGRYSRAPAGAIEDFLASSS